MKADVGEGRIKPHMWVGIEKPWKFSENAKWQDSLMGFLKLEESPDSLLDVWSIISVSFSFFYFGQATYMIEPLYLGALSSSSLCTEP